MRRPGHATLAAFLLLATGAAAETKEDAAAAAEAKPRILVLPLAASDAARGDDGRLFDARLLVALGETGRVDTVTVSSEPECADADCLASVGVNAGATHVLTTTLLAEDGRLTLFATLIDAATGVSIRRTELAGLDAKALSKTAAADVARWAAGTPFTVLLGVEVPTGATGRLAAGAVVDRLAALGSVPVVTLDAKTDRANLTHRAEIKVTEAKVVVRVHHVHRYLDGVLVATLSITDLASSKVIFSRTVKVTESRRWRFSSSAEVTALMVGGAVDEWMTAFRFEKVEGQLIAGTDQPKGRKKP